MATGRFVKIERKITVKKKTIVYIVWAVWYLLCMFLCFGKTPVGWAKAPFVLVSLLFYVPPFYLLFLSKKDTTKKTVVALRCISGTSLGLFLVLFVLNILSANWSAQAGRILYYLLIIFCAPVMCGQFFVLGLYLWAAILMVTLKGRNRPGRT